MTIKSKDVKSKLFFAYKIFFSLLIIPVVGIIVYKAIDKSQKNITWEEEGYFKNESEFKDNEIKAFIHKNLKPSQEVKFIDWSAKRLTVRERITLRWVKYSIIDSETEHETFYDRVFFIENGHVIKTVDLN